MSLSSMSGLLSGFQFGSKEEIGGASAVGVPTVQSNVENGAIPKSKVPLATVKDPGMVASEYLEVNSKRLLPPGHNKDQLLEKLMVSWSRKQVMQAQNLLI